MVSTHAQFVDVTNFKTTPYQYQLQGIQFGLTHDKFLLLDAPGLGKTLQICYIAQERWRRHEVSHCLIICGVNTLKYNWKREIQLHTHLSCKILGERTNKRTNKTVVGSIQDRVVDLSNPIDEFFVITNIETLRSDSIMKCLTNKTTKNIFDMIVVDEVHMCKNPSSIQGKHLLKLSAKYKIAATGTLITNNPLDAYVPLKWIDANKSNFSTFKYYYCNYGGSFHNELLGYKHIDILKDSISQVALRRTKDLLDLPSKTIINEIVELSDTQQSFYGDIVNGVTKNVDLVNIDSSNLLAMILRLRQASTCPQVLTTASVPSAKIDRTIDLINQIIDTGSKVVIFSSFKETINILVGQLRMKNVLVCTGDVPDSDISTNIEQFQNNDEYKVMLCTISKMGTGITLTAASYAIFIDCAYTAAQNLQCEDRIYRIGSKQPVFIYYLWAKGTVDERIKNIVEDKSAISDYIIDNKITQSSINSLRKYLQELS